MPISRPRWLLAGVLVALCPPSLACLPGMADGDGGDGDGDGDIGDGDGDGDTGDGDGDTGDGDTGDGDGDGDTGDGDGDGDFDACGNAPGQLGPPGAVWNTPIIDMALDAESDAIIGYLSQNHDVAARFQIDFSFEVLEADASVPHQPFTPSGDFYEVECDPAPIPVPPGGVLEGEEGYACTTDGDCHLIVVDRPECRLFEMWRAHITGPSYPDDFLGGCQAIWDLDVVYPPEGRGEQCTSADAAGLPIAPLLFTADEVAAGEIRHALRFILPNAHIRDEIYVHPATHSTGATSGGPDAPPYGARLRLKADVDLSGLNPAAQVIAEAMKTYGILLADAGNITFTGRSDRSTTTTWEAVGLGPHDLKDLQWSDFEVVDGGARIAWTGDCERTPVTE